MDKKTLKVLYEIRSKAYILTTRATIPTQAELNKALTEIGLLTNALLLEVEQEE